MKNISSLANSPSLLCLDVPDSLRSHADLRGYLFISIPLSALTLVFLSLRMCSRVATSKEEIFPHLWTPRSFISPLPLPPSSSPSSSFIISFSYLMHPSSPPYALSPQSIHPLPSYVSLLPLLLPLPFSPRLLFLSFFSLIFSPRCTHSPQLTPPPALYPLTYLALSPSPFFALHLLGQPSYAEFAAVHARLWPARWALAPRRFDAYAAPAQGPRPVGEQTFHKESHLCFMGAGIWS